MTFAGSCGAAKVYRRRRVRALRGTGTASAARCGSEGGDGAGNLVIAVGGRGLGRRHIGNEPAAEFVVDEDRHEQAAMQREQDAGGPRLLRDAENEAGDPGSNRATTISSAWIMKIGQ